jgi:hypothetical protein
MPQGRKKRARTASDSFEELRRDKTQRARHVFATAFLPNAMTFGSKAFEALNDAASTRPGAHQGSCVDVRRVLNGRGWINP